MYKHYLRLFQTRYYRVAVENAKVTWQEIHFHRIFCNFYAGLLICNKIITREDHKCNMRMIAKNYSSHGLLNIEEIQKRIPLTPEKIKS